MNTPTYVLHGYSTRLYAGLLWILAAAVAITGWGYGWQNFTSTVFIGIAIALVAWLCYWNPRVELTAGGVMVVNPFVTVQMAWTDIADCSSRWGLEIQPHEGKPVRVWSIPNRAAIREQFARPKAPTPINWNEHSGTEHVRVTSSRASEIIAIHAAEVAEADRAEHGRANRTQPHAPQGDLHVPQLAALILTAVAGGVLMFI